MYHLVLGLDQEAPGREPDSSQEVVEGSLRAINQLKLQEIMAVEDVVVAQVVWCQEVSFLEASEDWEEDKVEKPLNQVMAT